MQRCLTVGIPEKSQWKRKPYQEVLVVQWLSPRYQGFNPCCNHDFSFWFLQLLFSIPKEKERNGDAIKIHSLLLLSFFKIFSTSVQFFFTPLLINFFPMTPSFDRFTGNTPPHIFLLSCVRWAYHLYVLIPINTRRILPARGTLWTEVWTSWGAEDEDDRNSVNYQGASTGRAVSLAAPSARVRAQVRTASRWPRDRSSQRLHTTFVTTHRVWRQALLWRDVRRGAGLTRLHITVPPYFSPR